MQNVFFLIIMLLLLVLVIYLRFRQFSNNDDRKNALAIKVAIDRVIKRNKLIISEIDCLKNKLIALDRRNGKIILVEHRNNVTWEKCLSLADMSSCNISREMDQYTGSTQKVAIELNFPANSDPVSFSFYDSSRDPVQELPSRVKKANTWKGIIEHQLENLESAGKFEFVA